LLFATAYETGLYEAVLKVMEQDGNSFKYNGSKFTVPMYEKISLDLGPGSSLLINSLKDQHGLA
jgi:hypothetical protein